MENKYSTISERLGFISGPVVGGSVGATAGKFAAGPGGSLIGGITGAAAPVALGLLIGNRGESPDILNRARKDLSDSKMVKDILLPGYAYSESAERNKMMKNISEEEYDRLLSKLEERRNTRKKRRSPGIKSILG